MTPGDLRDLLAVVPGARVTVVTIEVPAAGSGAAPSLYRARRGARARAVAAARLSGRAVAASEDVRGPRAADPAPHAPDASRAAAAAPPASGDRRRPQALSASVWAARPAPLLWFVGQRDAGDCGVAALAMLLDVPYETALRACHSAPGVRLERGTSARQLVRAGRDLGADVRRVRAGHYHLRRCCGVLGVDLPDGRGHWVYVCGGVVYDPDGGVWGVGEFLATHDGRAADLLVRER